MIDWIALLIGAALGFAAGVFCGQARERADMIKAFFETLESMMGKDKEAEDGGSD